MDLVFVDLQRVMTLQTFQKRYERGMKRYVSSSSGRPICHHFHEFPSVLYLQISKFHQPCTFIYRKKITKIFSKVRKCLIKENETPKSVS